MDIRLDDLAGDSIRQLLEYHVEQARLNSPPGTSYALDLTALRAPEISFWTAWDGSVLLGCGALKQLTASHGEVKSMRTHPDHLQKGVAQALLRHIIAIARQRVYTRVSLETGTSADYVAAEALYRKHGFERGPIFGDYKPSDFNQFLHLELAK